MSPSHEARPSQAQLAELTHSLNRFFVHLDRSEYDALLLLTHRDFRWHRQGKVLDGHAAVLMALSERAPKQRTVHIITNAAIEAADHAELTLGAYMTAYRSEDLDNLDAPAVVSGPLRLSRVTTRFILDNQTGWLIAEQSLVPLFEFSATR